jgi:two-component system sensor histidine kinase YesM
LAGQQSTVIEASVRDQALDLVFSGEVSGSLIRRRVLQVTVLIVIVGASSLVIVVALWVFSLRTFNRMKIFEHEQLRARFEALQAKMNPHFMFNTLDSMIGAAEEGNKPRLMGMLRSLSSMLRSTIGGNRDTVTFAEELECVDNFVALQQMRYGGRFEMVRGIDMDVLECGVYRFSVQPLVENAFAHGVHETTESVRIDLTARRDGDSIIVEISDTGPGAAPEIVEKLKDSLADGQNKLEGWSALVGVHNRLRMIYGRPYGLSLLPTDKGFAARLVCPVVRLRGGREGP